MTIWEHLEELRERALISFGSVAALILGAFVFSKDLVIFLEQPVASTVREENMASSSSLQHCPPPAPAPEPPFESASKCSLRDRSAPSLAAASLLSSRGDFASARLRPVVSPEES